MKYPKKLRDSSGKLWTLVHAPFEKGGQAFPAEYKHGSKRGTPSLSDTMAIETGDIPRNVVIAQFQ